MPVSREFNHDLAMWERWFVEFNKHPLCNPEPTALALALFAFYYCDHAGHRTLSSDAYATAIEAIVPDSAGAFNLLLTLGEWERWVASWAGLHIKSELTTHRNVNRLMGMLEHRYIEPVSPIALARIIKGGCKIYGDLTSPNFDMTSLSPEMNKTTMRDVVINSPYADITWEEARDSTKP